MVVANEFRTIYYYIIYELHNFRPKLKRMLLVKNYYFVVEPRINGLNMMPSIYMVVKN